MKGSDLDFLIQVAVLGQLEFAAPIMSLHTLNDRIYAQYQGAYASGSRSIERPNDFPDLRFVVNSKRFATLADLFTKDEEIRVRKKGDVITLQAGRKRLQFQSAPLTAMYVNPIDLATVAVCDAKALKTEIGLAEDLNVKNHMLAPESPVGIHLVTIPEGNILQISAYNGTSAFLQTELICSSMWKEVDVTVLAKDIDTGIRLFEDGPIRILTDGKRVTFLTDNAWFSVVTTSAKWPNMTAHVSADKPVWTVSLTPDQIKLVTKAEQVIDTGGSVELIGKGGKLAIRTPIHPDTSEGYAIAIDGDLDGSFFYDTDSLLFISKLSKEPLTLEITQPRGVPTVVRSDNHLFLIMPKLT